MKVYIKALSNISLQNSFITDDILENLTEIKLPADGSQQYLRAIEPEYEKLIKSNMLRRMSRIIKMSLASAYACLEEANIKNPDGIITGTAIGAADDTEKFLKSIIVNNEKMLSPTWFIQSTHNTLSSQIAIDLKCNSYNCTYAHRGFSFNRALEDGVMLLNEGNGKNILVGGVEEMTATLFKIMQRLGHWKRANQNNNLLYSRTRGSLAGEGSAFFVISSEEDESNYTELAYNSTLYTPLVNSRDAIGKSNMEVIQWIKESLDNCGMKFNDIDLFITGISGDYKTDKIYYDLIDNCFDEAQSAYFKHLSGEYFTVPSFALWLGSLIVKQQHIPEIIKIGNKQKSANNVLIYNHFRNINHSMFVLKRYN